MTVMPSPLPPLSPISSDYWVTQPHTKLQHLFRAAVARGSALKQQKALAEALGVSAPRVNQCFGSAVDRDGARVPFQLAVKLAEAFQAENVTVEAEWLYQDLVTFDLYLAAQQAKSLGVRIGSWFDLVRRNARQSPGELLYERSLRGFRVRPDHEFPSSAAPQRFEIGEHAQLLLRPHPATTSDRQPLHAVILIEDEEKTECLFPAVPHRTLLAGRSLILPDPSILPIGEVTGPPGIQRIYAVLSTSARHTGVHAGLDGPELHRALDELATELGAETVPNWRLIAYTVEVFSKRELADGENA